MQSSRHFRWRIAETRRYFPEWADLPARRGVLHEASRNSYLAGGYAEEFGYGPQQGHPVDLRPLAGPPERSREWRAQIGALHPGYPQCPTPFDRGTDEFASAIRGHGGSVCSVNQPNAAALEDTWRASAFNVVIVSARARPMTGYSRGFPRAIFSWWREHRIRRRELGGFL